MPETYPNQQEFHCSFYIPLQHPIPYLLWSFVTISNILSLSLSHPGHSSSMCSLISWPTLSYIRHTLLPCWPTCISLLSYYSPLFLTLKNNSPGQCRRRPYTYTILKSSLCTLIYLHPSPDPYHHHYASIPFHLTIAFLQRKWSPPAHISFPNVLC